MGQIRFAENVKFLREKNNLKQADMLAACGFGRTTWNGYEKGISFPSFKDLVKISDYFDIDESDLIHSDLTKSDLNTFRKNAKKGKKSDLTSDRNSDLNTKTISQVNESSSTYYTGKMPAVVTVDRGGIDNILYVPVKMQAGYLLGHGDTEFIETLPSFRMPGLNNKSYRMFEVEGISMSPTLSDKDRVICEWVSSLSEIRQNRVHCIIHKNGLAIKRVLNRVEERGVLYLRSDTLTHRQNYPLIEIDPADVIEIWYVNLKISSDLREPSEIYTRLADMEILTHEIAKKVGIKL